MNRVIRTFLLVGAIAPFLAAQGTEAERPDPERARAHERLLPEWRAERRARLLRRLEVLRQRLEELDGALPSPEGRRRPDRAGSRPEGETRGGRHGRPPHRFRPGPGRDRVERRRGGPGVRGPRGSRLRVGDGLPPRARLRRLLGPRPFRPLLRAWARHELRGELRRDGVSESVSPNDRLPCFARRPPAPTAPSPGVGRRGRPVSGGSSAPPATERR